MIDKITTYKGLVASDYEIGKTYAHDSSILSHHHGWCADKYPLCAFESKSPSYSLFYACEQSEIINNKYPYDKMMVTSKNIILKEKVSVIDLIRETVAYVKLNNHNLSESYGYKSTANTATDYSVAIADGNNCITACLGEYNVAKSDGLGCVASSTGDYSAVFSDGNYNVSVSTGTNCAVIGHGLYNISVANGFNSISTTSGYGGVSITNHSTSRVEAVGEFKGMVAIGTRSDNKARASHGNWIILCKTGKDGNVSKIVTAQAGFTKGIKADTWYCLNEKSKFEECK